MCADSRIGNQFLYPGLGYGGSCFPKDTLAVCSMGRAVDEPCLLNEAVHEVNQNQRSWFWKKIVEEMGSNLSGKTLAFWGVAFKPRTDDIRESPSIALMQMALEAGATVRAFDPEAMDNLKSEVPEITACSEMYECIEGADALVVATEWSEFRSPDFDRISTSLSEKRIFDGRNVYKRGLMESMGFTYVSVGRPTVRPPLRPSVPAS